MGTPRIIDGDSIAFGELNVRLAGIDAPERGQECFDAGGDAFRCGRQATDYLAFLIGDGPVTCRGRGTDRWGRMIGSCRARGVDLSDAMVRRGWAVAYMGDLGDTERKARERGLGLWAGAFTPPAQWRRERRTAALDADPALAALGIVREGIAGLAARVRGEAPLRAPGDG